MKKELDESRIIYTLAPNYKNVVKGDMQAFVTCQSVKVCLENVIGFNCLKALSIFFSYQSIVNSKELNTLLWVSLYNKLQNHNYKKEFGHENNAIRLFFTTMNSTEEKKSIFTVRLYWH